MNIFEKSPIQKMLEELGASAEGETGWWEEVVARGLQEAAVEMDADTSGSAGMSGTG